MPLICHFELRIVGATGTVRKLALGIWEACVLAGQLTVGTHSLTEYAVPSFRRRTTELKPLRESLMYRT